MTAIAISDGRIILLNADMNPHQTIDLKKAANLLARDKAVIVEGDPLRKFGEWIYPKIMRLKEFIYLPWDKVHGPPRVSKRNILLRDGRKCAYCLAPATTIDHVHPRSKGGRNTWQNLVAACLKCNHKKGNRTLEQAGMTLLWKPYVPKRSDLR